MNVEEIIESGSMVVMNSGYAAFCTVRQLSEATPYATAVLICRELRITSSRIWESWEFLNENAVTTESLYESLRKIGAVL